MSDNSLILFFTYAALLCWFLCLHGWWCYWNQRISLNKRMRKDTPSGESVKEDSFRQSLFRLLVGYGEQLSSLGTRLSLFVKKDKLEQMLFLAGQPGGMTVESFLGVRMVLMVSGLIICNILIILGFPFMPLILIIVIAGSLWGPLLWLKSIASRRQEEIETSLPEFLDAMSVTLQAGVPLDPALQQIASRIHGPLKEEINQLNHELELGVPREQAYQRLVVRNDSRDLETLINSLLHGSKLGVPVSHSFKVMAEDMRTKRINRIKEKAQKASPKVTLVTAFIIVPSILFAVMGLLFLNIIFNPEALGLEQII